MWCDDDGLVGQLHLSIQSAFPSSPSCSARKRNSGLTFTVWLYKKNKCMFLPVCWFFLCCDAPAVQLQSPSSGSGCYYTNIADLTTGFSALVYFSLLLPALFCSRKIIIALMRSSGMPAYILWITWLGFWVLLSTCSSAGAAPSSERRPLQVCASRGLEPPSALWGGWSWGSAAGRRSCRLWGLLDTTFSMSRIRFPVSCF